MDLGRDTLLRFRPHATGTGLVRIGEPGPGSPVLLTGNFALTVRRLKETLKGRDVWLLVADSRGINVWCAAGGGHLTQHDVISVLCTSGIGEQVGHRDVVLPMLAATGVELNRVQEATGWAPRWGPARLEDLPAYLDRGCKVKRAERRMRFPLWERMEIAAAWSFWYVVFGLPVFALAGTWPAGVAAVAGSVIATFVLFALIHRVPLAGPTRWLTFAGLLGVACAVGAGVLLPLGATDLRPLIATGVGLLVATSTLVMDVAGTTPHMASSLNHLSKGRAAVEVLADRCTGDAHCVMVCPHEVLAVKSRHATVVGVERCVLCGACVVQCPADALQFRFPDGKVVEPQTVRQTRLNLLGKRSVTVGD